MHTTLVRYFFEIIVITRKVIMVAVATLLIGRLELQSLLAMLYVIITIALSPSHPLPNLIKSLRNYHHCRHYLF
jgi:hypothetical protein